MLTPRGVSDTRNGEASTLSCSVATADGTPRSRAALLESRRQGQTAEAARWAGSQSPRSMRCDMYRQDAVAAASSFMTKLLRQDATAADATAAASRLDRGACAPEGVRPAAGREEHCTTTFSSVSSKRIDSTRTGANGSMAPSWQHSASAADAYATGDFPGVAADNSRPPGDAARDSSHGRPLLPARRRRNQPVTRTVGRVANVGGASERVWLHKTYIFRPEVGTLDSYDVPVFSSFSGDKAFHPEMDGLLRKRKEAERAKRREELRVLKERDAHHRSVARDFEATIDRVRRMKEAARVNHSLVCISDDEAATLRSLEVEAARARREAAGSMPAPPSIPYDPHKAAKTPRSSVPGRPSERLLSAALRAAAAEDGASSTADASQTNEPSPRGRGAPSPPKRQQSASVRRGPSPAALAAKQALDFKVAPRNAEPHLGAGAATGFPGAPRPPSAAPAETCGPRAASAAGGPLGTTGNGMDLFALTRIPSAPGGPTPPPQPRPASTLNRPASAHASKRERTRPVSARASLRGAESPWGVQDNFAGGAFALQSASGTRSRPQSARARVVSADAEGTAQ